jgi:arylsulfatase A
MKISHLLPAFFLSVCLHASTERPNLLLIMADDMGYECLGANGGADYQTPFLDQLAAGGMRFEHAHSQPICTPSRVKIMTGMSNARNYVRFGILDPRSTTFGNLIQKAGYKTCIAGKWQLQGGFEGPNKFGFDEYCLWQLTRRPCRYPNPGFEINGKEVDFTNGEYGPDIDSDYLCKFMEENKEGPFLAYYPMILPHWPFQPTPDSKDWDPKETKEWPRNKWDKPHFQEMVAYVDKLVKKLVDKVDSLGIRENTLILFTCDNGTYTGITSKMKDGTIIHGGKGSTPDAGNRVPFIANWKGTIEPGQVRQELVDFSDVLPTLCEAAGAKIPCELPLDGQSFFPLLNGQPYTPKPSFYMWYARNGGPTGKEFARNQRYKLYRTGEFYDIDNDRTEEKPLAPAKLSTDAQAIRKMLQAKLDDYKDARKITSTKLPWEEMEKPKKRGGEISSL